MTILRFYIKYLNTNTSCFKQLNTNTQNQYLNTAKYKHSYMVYTVCLNFLHEDELK